MTEPRRLRVPVVIVGGGPAGLALAATLGGAGVRCVLVERQAEPSMIPKGQNLTGRSLEHFYFWGCVDELRAARLLPPRYPIGGITAYESLAGEYWYAPPGREAVAEYYFQRHERLPQYLTESVLRHQVRKSAHVVALFGWSAASIRVGGGRVRVTAVENSGGERCEIDGAYAVGCDGAHSMVREQAGITSSGDDFGQRMVLAVFRSPDLDKHLERFPPRTTYRVLHPRLKGYWWFFGRVDASQTWFFHAPLPPGAAAADLDVHALVQTAAGSAVSCDFQHVGQWDLRINMADTYQRGRLFIAGDAAHSHPPYGAYGLNTGLEDAVNLGWKLAAAAKGWGGPRLLGSYTAERHPVFAETGQAIAEGIASDRAFLGRFSPRQDREEFERAWSMRTSGDTAPPDYEPHYEGSPIVWGPEGSRCGTHGEHTFRARAGHHLAPAPLSSGRNIFEHLTGGYTFIALTGDRRPAAAVQAAARALRIPLGVIADTFGGERAAYGRRFILVRPDQYVAWAGDDPPADPAALLRRAAGADDAPGHPPG